MNKEAQKAVPSAADKKFFLSALVTTHHKPGEDGKYKDYLKQLKLETIPRIVDIMWNPEWGTLDQKFWLGFSQKQFKFLGWMEYK